MTARVLWWRPKHSPSWHAFLRETLKRGLWNSDEALCGHAGESGCERWAYDPPLDRKGRDFRCAKCLEALARREAPPADGREAAR